MKNSLYDRAKPNSRQGKNESRNSSGQRQSPAPPSGYGPQGAPRILQAKNRRTQPVMPSSQAPGRSRPHGSTPPAYRPQPTPMVLQPKRANNQRPSVSQVPRRPITPSVHN